MSEKNIQVIKDIYAAFGRGDVAAILANISEDLRLFGAISESQAAREVPWYAPMKSKAEVPKFFQALAENADFTRFEPVDYAAAGDVVYATISFDATIKRTGKKMQNALVLHRFLLKNGKVVEWRGSEDTARTVEAMRQ